MCKRLLNLEIKIHTCNISHCLFVVTFDMWSLTRFLRCKLVGNSTTDVSSRKRYEMLVEILGNVLNCEQKLRLMWSRDLRLMPVGRVFSFLQNCMSNFISLLRFRIEEGSSTKLLQDWRLSVSRLVAVVRSGISFRSCDPHKSISMRHVRDCTQPKTEHID